MKSGKFIAYKRGRDFVVAKKRLYILPESNLWTSDPDDDDDAERADPKKGDMVWFEESDLDFDLTAKDLESMKAMLEA